MEQLAARIGDLLAQQLNLDEDRHEVMTYGAIVLLQNGLTLILLVALGWWMAVLPAVMVTLAVAGVMRHASGGAHLSAPMRCVLLTTGTFLACGTASARLAVTMAPWDATRWLGMLLLLGALGYLVVLRYAPVEAESRPLSDKHKAKLRHQSVLFGGLMLGLVLTGCLLRAAWTVPVVAGFLVQAFTLTPTAHRLLHAFDQWLNRAKGR